MADEMSLEERVALLERRVDQLTREIRRIEKDIIRILYLLRRTVKRQ